MMESENKNVSEIEITTFTVPFAIGKMKEKISISTQKPSQEQIIDQAFKFHSEGNILEAVKLYEYFIDQGYSDHRVFSNYGAILKRLGKLEEAKISLRKAIQLKPDFAPAHSNLGAILKRLDKLEEAEISLRKAIELDTELADAHYNLGVILKRLDKLEEAEISLRKAIQLKPDFAPAHSNLENILKKLGKL